MLSRLRPRNEVPTTTSHLEGRVLDQFVEETSSDEFDDPYGTASDVEEFPSQEVAKMAALIMARNLNHFLFHDRPKKMNPKHDDIFMSEFGLRDWSPGATAEVSTDIKDRLDKIAGHIVKKKQIAFKHAREVMSIVIPLIHQSRNFIEECRKQNRAEWTGAAEKYRDELNKLLPDLGIEVISE